MIRFLQENDIEKIDNNFIEQNWGSRKEVLLRYIKEQNKDERVVLVYESNDDIFGYITLVINPSHGPFKNKNIPEIVDFNVFEKYQRNGVGELLLKEIIQYASKYSDTVGIGVGLNSNYGKAQRLYIKNGFTPDGNGIYYNGEIIKPNDMCKNDDDLAMYFTKKIK